MLHTVNQINDKIVSAQLELANSLQYTFHEASQYWIMGEADNFYAWVEKLEECAWNIVECQNLDSTMMLYSSVQDVEKFVNTNYPLHNIVFEVRNSIDEYQRTGYTYHLAAACENIIELGFLARVQKFRNNKF